METARDVLLLIALGAVSALCVYLIIVLASVRRLVDSLQSELRAASSKALPVLDNLKVITDHVRNAAEAVSEHIDGVRGSIESFRHVAADIVELERRVQERIEEPLMDIIDSMTSLFRNAQALIDRIPFIGRSRAQ